MLWRGLRHITDKIFLTTAEVIAQQVSDKHLEEGRLYPPLDTIRDVSLKIAEKIVKDAYQEKTATVYPEPQTRKHLSALRCIALTMTRFYLIVILGLKRPRKYRPNLTSSIIADISNSINEVLKSFMIFKD